MTKDYKFFVTKGRELAKELLNLEDKTKCYQAKIAKYAVSVCDIRHGGRTPEDRYTLKKYAEDIGVVCKTLQNWVQVYRNVLVKLNLKDPSKEEWGRALKTNEILRKDRAIENKSNGEAGSKKAFKRNISPAKIQNIYDAGDPNGDFKPFVNECSSMIKSVMYAKNILKKRDMRVVPDSRLICLMELLDESSDIINDYLTKKHRQRVG